MNLEVKSALIIAVTMIIGILIGTFIVAPQIARRYLTRIEMLRHEPGFARGIEGMILPDQSQRERIRPIIKKYGGRFETLFQRHREEVQALVDSLRAELDPLLTEEQRQRLERIRSRRCLHPHRR